MNSRGWNTERVWIPMVALCLVQFSNVILFPMVFRSEQNGSHFQWFGFGIVGTKAITMTDHFKTEALEI